MGIIARIRAARANRITWVYVDPSDLAETSWTYRLQRGRMPLVGGGELAARLFPDAAMETANMLAQKGVKIGPWQECATDPYDPQFHHLRSMRAIVIGKFRTA
jgi:hypothetical protein